MSFQSGVFSTEPIFWNSELERAGKIIISTPILTSKGRLKVKLIKPKRINNFQRVRGSECFPNKFEIDVRSRSKPRSPAVSKK